MKPNKTLYASMTALALLLMTHSASAVPAVERASDEVDDATLTLRILENTIEDDVMSWCEVSIDITEEYEPLTEDDPVYIWVYEDDTFSNDLIWSTVFGVTAQEASAGRVQRTFDCSAEFGGDGIGEVEFFAEAKVEKDECGTFCVWDRPTTGNITSVSLEDDGDEPNDSDDDATGLALGNNRDFIAADQDWFVFSTGQPSRLTLDLTYRTNVGRLDMTVFDGALEVIDAAVDNDDGGTLIVERIEAGEYFVRVAPRSSSNYNFYDLRMIVDTLAADCVTGETESEACGNCGASVRTCDDNGRWGPFAACADEGVCGPGEESVDGCGNCGTALSTCTDTCEWGAPGACEGEGECAPEAVETQVCDAEGTEHSRMCSDACVWGEYAMCGETICSEGESRSCYTGPEGTEGVGVCGPGMQRCTNNTWGQCRGDMRPVVEACANSKDDDCDGMTDAADTDCADTGSPIGDPCAEDDECLGSLECVGLPQDAVFDGGYCGKAECDGDADCGDEGFCGTAFDENYCLKTCSGSGDCRDGYLCADVGGRKGCVPRCRADNHCRGTAAPTCNPDTGLCEALGGGGDDNSNDNTGGPDDNAGGPGTGDNAAVGNNAMGGGDPQPASGSDEGCAVGVGPAPTPLGALVLLALGLVAVVVRRAGARR